MFVSQPSQSYTSLYLTNKLVKQSSTRHPAYTSFRIAPASLISRRHSVLYNVCSTTCFLQSVLYNVPAIFLSQHDGYIAGDIVTVYRSASSATTYDPLGVAVALNFTTRSAAGSAPPPPSSASAPTSAVSGDLL